MLSIESQAIYDILCDITELSEVYKIVDADEINEKLPVGITLTKVQLSQIIRDLKDRDYVDIKYFTPDEYCLRVIKRVDPVEKQTSARGGGSGGKHGGGNGGPGRKTALRSQARRRSGKAGIGAVYVLFGRSYRQRLRCGDNGNTSEICNIIVSEKRTD